MGQLYIPEKPKFILPNLVLPGAESPFDSGPIVVTPPPAKLGIYHSVEDFKFHKRAHKQRLKGLPVIGGGAAGAWTFTNGGRTSLLNGTFDIDSDTWKLAIFLSTSNIGAASTTYAGLTNEHANANGYTTGGIAITLTLAGTTTVTVDISVDPVWTASGGNITGRFGVIYEVSGNVLCYCLLDSTPGDVTATNGNTLTVAAHADGVFTLA